MTVEFLPGDEPEEQPGSSRGTRPRIRWWLVGALVVGVAAWAVSRPSSLPRPVDTSPAPVSTVADPACRGVPDCAVHNDVPAAVSRLARSYLPPGMHLRVHTVVSVSSLTQEELLVERDIDASGGSVTVLIRVQRGGSGAQEIAPDPLGVGSVLLHQVNSGFLVRLQYLAPETVPPMLDRLQAFIHHPGLVTS